MKNFTSNLIKFRKAVPKLVFLILVGNSMVLAMESVELPTSSRADKTYSNVDDEVFPSVQEVGVIGVNDAFGKDNPNDNYFTILLPDQFQAKEEFILLEYELYGLEDASQTTKSINNSESFGGQIIQSTYQWKKIIEKVPANLFKAGLNEIYFTRRKNESYQYKIRNLKLNTASTTSKEIFFVDNQLKNYNGKVYLLGYASKDISAINVLNQKIPVKDGRFEIVLKNISPKVEILEFSYNEGKSKIERPVRYFNKDIEFEFNPFSENFKVFEPNSDHTEFNFHAIGIHDNSQLQTRIHFKALDFKDIRLWETSMTNVGKGDFLAYRIAYEKLESPLRISFDYDVEKIPSGYSPKDIKTYYYDIKRKSWVGLKVDSIDYQNQKIISWISNENGGETDYINGIISVPEMPESSSFVPTTISDIEFANPASGIVPISIPSPNETGSLATGFPLKLPTGRNGMSPNLSVNYNSENGNGWLGVGWDLHLPAITLDTRWGVPRFDAINESELYLLNGQSLALKHNNNYTSPHRNSDNISRMENRVFYLRTESSYSVIERKGSSPHNYYWVVTDKMGNKSYYGQTQDSKLKNENGQIVHWALNKTIDPSGNFIEYTYSTALVETDNGIQAKSFLPETIAYTKHASSLQNYYLVSFKNQNSMRNDMVIDARTSTLTSKNGFLLDSIKVEFIHNGVSNLIRTYSFDYDQIAFNKNQLIQISESDANNDLFYTNTFEYYNDIDSQNIINSNDQKSWNSSYSPTISSGLLEMGASVANLPNGNSLGTSTSQGWAAGLRIGFGIGYKENSVSTTVGGSYNYNNDNQQTKIIFIDINGDGLPDQVFRDNTGLKYLANLGIQANGNGLFSSSPKDLLSISLDQTKSRTNSFGFDVNVEGIGIGKSFSTTKSETSYYLNDFNGDGLIDVASINRVLFSPKINSVESTIIFTTDSHNTFNPIESGNINNGLINELDLPTINQLRSEHPQFDHVTVWRAPYDGSINITGNAKLTQLTNDCGNPNQFRLTIEKDGATWQDKTFTALNQTNSMAVSNYKIVSQGDLIFFRIHNLNYGCGGTFDWNPIISYTSSGSAPTGYDENNKAFRIYNAEEDFILNNGGTWIPPINTTSFSVQRNLSNTYLNNQNFSDKLTFVIEKITYDISSEGALVEVNREQDKRVFIPGQSNPNLNTSPLSNFLTLNPQFTYEYKFYVESDSNVAWEKINWRPKLTYSGSATVYPPVSYNIYDHNTLARKYEFLTSNFPTPNAPINNNPLLTISHNMFELQQSVQNDLYDVSPVGEGATYKINWVVKKQSNNTTELIDSRTFYLHKYNCGGIFDMCDYKFTSLENFNSPSIHNNTNYFEINLSKQQVENLSAGDKIYSAFYVEEPTVDQSNLSQSFSYVDFKIDLHENEESNYNFNPILIDAAFLSKSIGNFGISNHGWGYFLYNSGVAYNFDDQVGDFDYSPSTPPYNYSTPIDISVFDQDNYNISEEDFENVDPEEMNIDGTSPRFTFYVQDMENETYTNTSIINRKVQVNNQETYYYATFGKNNNLQARIGRFGESDLSSLMINFDDSSSGSSLFALKQLTKSKGNATTVSAGVGFFGEAGTISNSNSKVLTQYIDLNGDRYPDLVTENKIQFTDMKGGLYDVKNNNFVTGSHSRDETVGVNIAGVIPNSTKKDNAKINNSTNTNIESGYNNSSGTNYNSNQWIDINGDGLPDKVSISESSVSVRLNLGYKFGNEVVWGDGYSNLVVSSRESQAISLGGGLSFNKINASFAVGLGGGESTASMQAVLLDVNGDGLPDLVKKSGNSYIYYLNKGTKFSTSPKTFYSGSEIDQDYSLSGNIYGTVSKGFVFKVFGFPFKVVFTPTASSNASISEKRITVQDIDGDGLPDILMGSQQNGEISAFLNRTGKTHLLKKVNSPLGASWNVGYQREGNTIHMPQSIWAMSSISTHDGFEEDSDFSPDVSHIEIKYKNPKHDRRERSFLGFKNVIVNQRNKDNTYTYRSTESEYHTENIYLKGLVKRQTNFAGDYTNNIKLSETKTLYNLMNPDNPQTTELTNSHSQYLALGFGSGLELEDIDKSRLFLAPVNISSTVYEEDGESLTSVQKFVSYDAYGNLLIYKNLGNPNYLQDDYTTTMEYYSNIPGISNARGFVQNIKVHNTQDELLRQREITYNSIGKPETIMVKLNDTENSSTNLNYDNFGNLIEWSVPNPIGGYFSYNLSYENVMNSYPKEVTNPFGETSTIDKYEYLFGTPLLITDVNGNQMRTRIDDRGRTVEVTGPNELANPQAQNQWTIRMSYNNHSPLFPNFNGNNYMLNSNSYYEAVHSGTPTNKKHYAVTRHNMSDSDNPNLQLLTVNISDGAGKPIQLKKAIESMGVLKWQISGKQKFDDFGRVIESYLPTATSYNMATIPNYISTINSIPPSLIQYDVKDRPVSATQSGASNSTVFDYSIQGDRFIRKTTNELGQTNETQMDVRGQLLRSTQNDEINTYFTYNAIGEKVKVKNQQGYESLYLYDLAGRRISEANPDRGVTAFAYDINSNLIKKWTSNLMNNGNPIEYSYDFNRLTKIIYPENPENNVEFIYGSANTPDGAGENIIGRLFIRKDASGVEGFTYDKMGNIKDNMRGVAVAGRHTFWFWTKFEYDSHNRIKKIVYPDFENIFYHYDQAGGLNRISRDQGWSEYPNEDIISEIIYNDYGEREHIVYGNGTKSEYSYDDRRRMNTLSHNFNLSNASAYEITQKYTYDDLNNITSKTTLNPNTAIPIAEHLGGPMTHNYEYDEFNRLVYADGRYTGRNDDGLTKVGHEYTLHMKYDMAHNILLKHQTHLSGATTDHQAILNDPQVMPTQYHLEYNGYAQASYVSQHGDMTYAYMQPHAVREIIETPEENTALDSPERIKKLMDYDANGNRISEKQQVYKGEAQNAYEGIPSAEEIVTREYLWDEEDRLRAVNLNPEKEAHQPLSVYTYDAAGQRVVRYVPGRLDAYSNEYYVSANQREEVMMYPSPMITAKAMSEPGVAPDQYDLVTKYTKHYYVGSERISSSLGANLDLGLAHMYAPMVFLSSPLRTYANTAVVTANTAMGITYDYWQQNISIEPPVIEDYYKGEHSPELYDAYWYHPDHLGSSSYITNLSGRITQHMEYLPFGETLVDEHLNSHNSPFKFNAKEFDSETGNYYYGARYYNPKISMWLSVDPLAEKYIGISPYAFTANNPIRFREVDGRYFEEGSKSAKQANRIERQAEKQANKLERQANKLNAKGKSTGDLTDRVKELRQSAQDVRDMQDDPSTEYKYAKLDGKEGKALELVGPSTTLTGQNGKGDNVVTMFTEKNMGNQLHETRHGGQNARGEYNVATGAGYGVADEVSAYRAQYSWDGNLKFMPYTDFSNNNNVMQMMTQGIQSFIQNITNINQITPNFVNTLVDNPGLNQILIYPPPSIPLNIWNSN